MSKVIPILIDKEYIIELIYKKLNLLSLSIPISILIRNNDLKKWIGTQQLPSTVNTIKFSSFYIFDLFNSFNLDEFEIKSDRAYTEDEYVNQIMNYLAFTSIYNMMEKNHPSINEKYFDVPCIFYDNNSSAYLIVNNCVIKYNLKNGTIGNKISIFFT